MVMNLTKLLEIAEKAGAFLFARKKWLQELHFTSLIWQSALCAAPKSDIKWCSSWKNQQTLNYCSYICEQ
jgi:hypothetical protein